MGPKFPRAVHASARSLGAGGKLPTYVKNNAIVPAIQGEKCQKRSWTRGAAAHSNVLQKQVETDFNAMAFVKAKLRGSSPGPELPMGDVDKTGHKSVVRLVPVVPHTRKLCTIKRLID